MNRIIGRFCFKLVSNGNLIGSFSNNLHTINYLENAQKLSGIGFIGQYNSNWVDDTGGPYQAVLDIQLKANSVDIYTLTWLNGAIQFFGEGFVIDDTLIGDYRNFAQI